MLSSGSSLIVTLAILGYILWNQMQIRTARTTLTLPLVLVVLGVANLSQYLPGQPLTAQGTWLLAASLLFAAIGLGALRAYTVRLWRDGGKVLLQGTYVTAV